MGKTKLYKLPYKYWGTVMVLLLFILIYFIFWYFYGNDHKLGNKYQNMNHKNKCQSNTKLFVTVIYNSVLEFCIVVGAT